MAMLENSLRKERTQGILVPCRRWRALIMLLAWLLGAGVLLLFVLFIGPVAITLLNAQDRLLASDSSDFSEVSGFFLFMGLLGLLFISMGFWSCLSALRFACTRRPALAITREGIWIARRFDPFLGGGDAIAWDEIQRIDLSSHGRKVFCIYLNSSREYSLHHYSGWKRFVLRREIAGSEPICIAQAYVGQPLDKVMARMISLYTREIALYGIRLDRNEQQNTLDAQFNLIL